MKAWSSFAEVVYVVWSRAHVWAIGTTGVLTKTNVKAIWMESIYPATEIECNKFTDKSTCSNSCGTFFFLLCLSWFGPQQTACYHTHISQYIIQATSAQIVPWPFHSLSFYIVLGDGQTSKEQQLHTKKPHISPHRTCTTRQEAPVPRTRMVWRSKAGCRVGRWFHSFQAAPAMVNYSHIKNYPTKKGGDRDVENYCTWDTRKLPTSIIQKDHGNGETAV